MANCFAIFNPRASQKEKASFSFARFCLDLKFFVLAREPGGTRIPNLLIRSQMLYPIKLQVHSGFCTANSPRISPICQAPTAF